MKVISKCLCTVCFLIFVSLLFHLLIPETRSSAIVESKLLDSSRHSSYVKDELAAHTKKINLKITEELQEIYNSSQINLQVLESAIKTYGAHSKEVNNVVENKFMQDSINLKKVEEIINKYGWPGEEQIGAQNNYTLFTTIQNADFETQEKYLPIMERAVKSGTLAPECFASLVDRKALVQHQKQIFGTQLKRERETGDYTFAPIIEEETVNLRRKEIGLPPIEEFAKTVNAEYQPSRKRI